jgi:putative N6-adenine-specific DNA methylase
MTERYSLFAVAAPGLEPLVLGELEGLGLGGTAEPGGVAFEGTIEDVALANLWLRTATRVLARVGEFGARALGELERRAGLLPWERFLAPGREVRLRATSKKSRLYHEKAVMERIANGITSRTGANPVGAARGPEEEETGSSAQLIVARMLRDRCTISIDTSGELLHRRGYRLESAKAPLRETLAAALLVASRWDPETPLLDPMCGSGTIPIEAALLARRIPPGLTRSLSQGFAFEHWPGFDGQAWAKIRDLAREGILPRAPAAILGSDRDAGAITAAEANATRAGVAGDIEFRRHAISAIEPPEGPGAIVSNPPYGVRVGEGGRVRDLYAQLGHVVRRKAVGWSVTLLLPDAPLERQTGLGFEEALRTTNGGLAVRALRAAVSASGSAGGAAGSGHLPGR